MQNKVNVLFLNSPWAKDPFKYNFTNKLTAETLRERTKRAVIFEDYNKRSYPFAEHDWGYFGHEQDREQQIRYQ